MNLRQTIETEYENLEQKVQTPLQVHSENENVLFQLFKNFHSNVQNESTNSLLMQSPFRTQPNNLKKKISQIDYNASDIFQLCYTLRTLENKKELEYTAGFFLTLLISEHYKKTKQVEPYLLVTEELPLMYELCSDLQGENVEIIGSAGKRLGAKIQKGNIHVQGSVLNNCGQEMSGGKITVDNCAGDYCGYEMIDGEIIIKKSAGNYAGKEMSGGYIRIEGSAGDYAGEKMGNSIYFRQDFFHKKNYGGTIVICGNSGMFAGYGMRHGLLVLKGYTRHNLGRNMEGGTIIVETISEKDPRINMGNCAMGGKMILYYDHQTAIISFGLENDKKIISRKKIGIEEK